MKVLVRAVALALALSALVLAGCAAEPAVTHDTEGVWGYVASADDAQLEVSSPASAEELIVDRVKSPGDAWIVVHLDDDGKPGMRVGLAAIPEGESTDVAVDLEGVEGDSLIVAVHADRGEPGTFDFDMEDPTGSPDRPYFVDQKELAVVASVE